MASIHSGQGDPTKGMVTTDVCLEKSLLVNSDNEQLVQMGYTAELTRNFSIISLASLGFIICSSWGAAITTMAVGLPQGGLMTIVWGFVVVCVFLGASALTLGELASAFPSAGGQHQYVNELCSVNYSRIASYFTAWTSMFAWVTCTCSMLLIAAKTMLGLVVLCRSDYVIETWHTFVVYQGMNILGVVIIGWGSVLMPLASKAGITISLTSFLIYFIVVPVRSPYKNDASFVFSEFMNETGWNPFICFMTGLANSAYMLAGLDSVVHMAEEIPEPRKNIPRALISVVVMGFITAVPFLIEQGFYFPPIEEILNHPTGIPSIAIPKLTFRLDGFVIFLQVLNVILSVFILASIQLVTSRTVFAISRDGGLPFHKYFATVWKDRATPFRATILQGVACAIIGCLYVGSSTAFNSIIASTVTFYQLSYAFPALVMLTGGRKRLEKVQGTFYLGSVVGTICASMTVFWGVVYLIFFSFPYYIPTDAVSMNYTSAVVGALFVISIMCWFVYGKKNYKGPARITHE